MNQPFTPLLPERELAMFQALNHALNERGLCLHISSLSETRAPFPPPTKAEIAAYRDPFRAELDKRMDTSHPSASPSTEAHQIALHAFVEARNKAARTEKRASSDLVLRLKEAAEASAQYIGRPKWKSSEVADIAAAILTLAKLCHEAADALSAPTESVPSSEWFEFEKAQPARDARVRIRLFSGTEVDARYFDGDFQTECVSVNQWITGNRVYKWRNRDDG